MSAVRGVVFDYGGVLTTPPREAIAAWTEDRGIAPSSFSRVLKAWLSRSAPESNPLHRLEQGALTREEFDEILDRELTGVDGGPVESHGHLADIFGRIRPEPTMVDALAALRERGFAIAMLSNSWGNEYPDELRELCDVVVVSGEVGLRKPQPEIYRMCLERMGMAPEQVLFVDDGAPNVEAAERLGMRTLLHSDPAASAAELAALPTPDRG